MTKEDFCISAYYVTHERAAFTHEIPVIIVMRWNVNILTKNTLIVQPNVLNFLVTQLVCETLSTLKIELPITKSS